MILCWLAAVVVVNNNNSVRIGDIGQTDFGEAVLDFSKKAGL
jgi:hypothetical protein